MAAKKTPNKTKLRKLVADALEILNSFGIPVAEETERRQTRIAKAFIAVTGMTSDSSWTDAKSDADGHRLRSREVLA
jgi:hypothetical protein